MYKYILCIICCFACDMSGQDAENELIHCLMESFLESVNNWEGIEYAGGPYQIGDYLTDINKCENGFEYVFRYKQKPAEMVFSDPISIRVCFELNEIIRSALVQTYQNIDKNNSDEIHQILSALVATTISDPDVPEYIEINHGEITYRGREKRNYLHNFKKINDSTYQLFLYRPFSSEEMELFLNRRQSGFTMVLENGCIKPTSLPIIGRDSYPLDEKQSFLLLGKLDDHELKMCIELLKKDSWDRSISALEVIEDQSSTVSNNIKYITVYWGRPEHHLVMDSVIVKQEHARWTVSQVLSVDLTDSITLYPMIVVPPVSFREKPQREKIAGYAVSLQAKLSLENRQGINEHDISSIAEFLLRLRCIEDYTDITVLKNDDDTVEIVIRGIDCKSMQLQKTNKTWMIKNLSTCFR